MCIWGPCSGPSAEGHRVLEDGVLVHLATYRPATLPSVPRFPPLYTFLRQV